MKHKETYLLLKAISFAAYKHRFQRRKDADKTPYINHPIQVAFTLIDIGKEEDHALLVAAVLHDTIEDTETTGKEIKNLFGKEVCNLVLEVTDDKTLPKQERKRLQVVNASHKSAKAKKIKLADKICNITDIIDHPPKTWTAKRKLGYLSWVEQVMAGLIGANPSMEKHLTKLIAKGRKVFAQSPT